jgi:hypothetical protein
MSIPVYVLVESSPAGDYIVGVFSTYQQARATLHRVAGDQIEPFRIELHMPDEPPDAPTAWLVRIERDGGPPAVTRFAGCSSCDEERLLANASFIEAGGARMQVIVRAWTPGQALAAAGALRRRLLALDEWGTEFRPLAPIDALGSPEVSDRPISRNRT